MPEYEVAKENAMLYRSKELLVITLMTAVVSILAIPQATAGESMSVYLPMI